MKRLAHDCRKFLGDESSKLIHLPPDEHALKVSSANSPALDAPNSIRDQPDFCADIAARTAARRFSNAE